MIKLFQWIDAITKLFKFIQSAYINFFWFQNIFKIILKWIYQILNWTFFVKLIKLWSKVNHFLKIFSSIEIHYDFWSKKRQPKPSKSTLIKSVWVQIEIIEILSIKRYSQILRKLFFQFSFFVNYFLEFLERITCLNWIKPILVFLIFAENRHTVLLYHMLIRKFAIAHGNLFIGTNIFQSN